jgi:hypothetical protein
LLRDYDSKTYLVSSQTGWEHHNQGTSSDSADILGGIVEFSSPIFPLIFPIQSSLLRFYSFEPPVVVVVSLQEVQISKNYY